MLPLRPSTSKREDASEGQFSSALFLGGGFSSPGLLDDVVGPHQAAHVPGAVVEAGEGLEGAKNGVGQHQYKRPQPGGSDDLGSVGFCLPRPGGEGVANGTVALQGDGHQVKGGDAHRDTCRGQKIHTVLIG